jgi:hypothetical protein
MIKRLLVMLLIGLLVFSVAACFGNSEPGEEPGDEPGEEPGEEPGAEPGEEPGKEPGEEPGEEEPSDTTFGSNIGGWGHLNFKPGQYFYYDVSSDRTGEGWVSIRIEKGDKDDTLAVTCEGDWGLGEFSDTATFTKGMSGWDLAMELSTVGSNAMISLLNGAIIPLDKAVWEEGAEVAYGDNTFSCTGTAEHAGVTGLTMVCDSKHSFTGDDLHYIYRINFDFPLPLFLESPAANDIWRYTLSSYEGI